MTRAVTPATTSVSGSEVIVTRSGVPSSSPVKIHCAPTGMGKKGWSISAENGPASGAQIAMSSSPLPVGVAVGVTGAVGGSVDVGTGVVGTGCTVAVEVAVGLAGVVRVGAGVSPSSSSFPQPGERSSRPRMIAARVGDQVFIEGPPSSRATPSSRTDPQERNPCQSGHRQSARPIGFRRRDEG
jgi:hypothetical protein